MRLLRLSLLILTILCIGWGPMMLSTKPITYQCLLGDNYQPTPDSGTSVAAWGDKEWYGVGYKDTTESHCICRLAFTVAAIGNPGQFTWYAKIGTLNSDYQVASVQATSAGVTGGQNGMPTGSGWGATEVYWDFTPCQTVAANPPYGHALIIGRAGNNSTNYLVASDKSSGAWSEGTGIYQWTDAAGFPWNDTTNDPTVDAWIKIFDWE